MANVLNRYLGGYVDGVNPQQLRVGVWQGDVQLEGLALKRDALRELNLPLDIKGACVLPPPLRNAHCLHHSSCS